MMREFLLNSINTSPDVIVISSSRGGFISSNIFPGKKISNNFLRGASLEDYLALYDIVESKKWKPAKIVFTLDPWLLNDNNEAVRWMMLEKNYNSMLKKLNITNTPAISKTAPTNSLEFEKALQLVSFSYFKQAYIYLRKNKRAFYPTDNRCNEGLTYLADGSMCYDKQRRKNSIKAVDKLAVNYIQDEPVYCLGRFSKLSAAKIVLLEKLVDHIKSQGIEVEFYLPPYHPMVYDYLTKTPKYKEVFAAEAYYVDLAKRKNLVYCGSFNPAAYGLNKSWFYDGMHAKEKAVELIFKSTAIKEAHLINSTNKEKI
ncbi:MAG: hypothetical protein ABIN95_07015, partial [Mucilaginibacter sp.]